jgi:hypothetical protein
MPVEIDFACPSCGREALLPDLEAAPDLTCPCGLRRGKAGGWPGRCALCGDPRLYRQKDFSRKVGIGLLALGFGIALVLGVLAGPWGFFLALGASAALDGLLWLVAGTVVICHWCEAHYRGGPEDVPEFDLAVHDVVRHQREVAAGGRPVPEHEGRAAAPGDRAVHPTAYDGPRTPPAVRGGCPPGAPGA